jgi:flagellar FliJ protein
MAKSLKSLIRLHRWTVDERRRELGAFLAREEQLRGERRRIDDELASEKKIATEDVMAAFGFAGYIRGYMERREMLDRAIAAAMREIEAAQERLAEAYRQLKTFEITQANREKRELAERNRAEQIVLDEVGATLHRRRQEAEQAA